MSIVPPKPSKVKHPYKLNNLRDEIRSRNIKAGWVKKPNLLEKIFPKLYKKRDKAMMIALIHSEVSEALEGVRKGLKEVIETYQEPATKRALLRGFGANADLELIEGADAPYIAPFQDAVYQATKKLEATLTPLFKKSAI